jgi:hypothetical protein
MTFLPAVLAAVVLPTLPMGSSAQSRTALASLRHDYRPLLVFAASDNQDLREQMTLFAEQIRDMQERQVVFVPILLSGDLLDDAENATAGKDGLPEGSVVRLSEAEDTAARRRFHVGEDEFTVILLGKDGGEKLRSRAPVRMERLVKVIDSMPMRQKEARDGHSG